MVRGALQQEVSSAGVEGVAVIPTTGLCLLTSTATCFGSDRCHQGQSGRHRQALLLPPCTRSSIVVNPTHLGNQALRTPSPLGIPLRPPRPGRPAGGQATATCSCPRTSTASQPGRRRVARAARPRSKEAGTMSGNDMPQMPARGALAGGSQARPDWLACHPQPAGHSRMGGQQGCSTTTQPGPGWRGVRGGRMTTARGTPGGGITCAATLGAAALAHCKATNSFHGDVCLGSSPRTSRVAPAVWGRCCRHEGGPEEGQGDGQLVRPTRHGGRLVAQFPQPE